MLAEASHNPFLALTSDYVMDFISSVTKAITKPDIELNVKVNKDHRTIFNAIKRRDSQEAGKIMIRHIEMVSDYLTSREQTAIRRNKRASD